MPLVVFGAVLSDSLVRRYGLTPPPPRRELFTNEWFMSYLCAAELVLALGKWESGCGGGLVEG